jgi:proline iminopeptidase
MDTLALKSDQEFSMTLSKGVKRVVSVLIFLFGAVIAMAASFVAAYQAAKFTPRVGLLILVALFVFSLLIFVVIGLASKPHGTFLNRYVVRASAIMTVLFCLALYFAFLRPAGFAHLDPIPRADTRYWNLSTGSHIAYSLYEPPAGVSVKQDPIVFVHGGPGLRAFNTDHDFYRQFAQDGFRVYLFDQVGSGLSARLPHAEDYSVERFVADLESIRQQIGADRLILIGHSWGGTLIAHYAAAHPEHVAKLVFHSPGPIWKLTSAPFQYRRTDAQAKRPLPPVRVLAAIALSHANWDAAENLLPQQASGGWETANMDPGELVCKGQGASIPSSLSGANVAGLNLYPLLVANRELNDKSEMDIRRQLGRLHVPAIALVSECDFVPWSQQLEYKKSIPGLQQFYFPDSGHYINLSQPQKLTGVIRSFLLDEPSPTPAYMEDKDPRPSEAHSKRSLGKEC